jgi:DNA (cytosine-5)-methyltransferase 1
MAMAFSHLDLFTGIGGFSLAASWVWGAAHRLVGFCEIDPHCQRVLQRHWPNVTIYPDVRQLNGGTFESLDLITGGFPCQPFSGIGKRRGTRDDRYLWPEMLRVISEAKPRWILCENVPGLLSIDGGMVFETVLSSLEANGYQTQSFVIPACSKGTIHRRDRVWIVAHAAGKPIDVDMGIGTMPDRERWLQEVRRRSARHIRMLTRQVAPSEWRIEGEPGSRPLLVRNDDGVPHRVDRLRALGNAIVPQIAAQIMLAIRLSDKEEPQ